MSFMRTRALITAQVDKAKTLLKGKLSSSDVAGLKVLIHEMNECAKNLEEEFYEDEKRAAEERMNPVLKSRKVPRARARCDVALGEVFDKS